MYNFFEKKIPHTQRNQKRIEVIEKEGERLLSEAIKSLSFSKYKLFYETGNRLEYEGQQMEHRRRLAIMAAMALWSDDKKWIEALEDTLWAICDEFTWDFPAHIKQTATPDECATVMALFSAETAMALSEVLYLLGERLHPIVYKRVIHELRRRTIEPHMTDVYTYRSNWSVVCASGVAFAIMYHGTKEEFEQAKDSLVQSANDFLDSYTDDGCCLEGPTYWAYGFSHFVFLAAMLREYTKGEIDLFKSEKVKNIALYPQRTRLEEDYVVPFGDTMHRYKYEYCVMNFLAHEYEEVVVPEPDMMALHEYSEHRDRFGRFIRDFFWTEDTLPAKRQGEAKVEEVHIFEDSQQYVRRYNDFIFVAKGGYNSEPHNHNDIGSFIIFSDKKYLLDDLGWAEYDNLYFTARRYENICASSLGHSVPIVNGKAQKPGMAVRAVASYGKDYFGLDMTAAYDIDKVTRTFGFEKENGISIQDSFVGDNLQITERFITREKPQICEGVVQIGKLTIKSRNACKIQLSEQEFYPRVLGDLNEKETAYLIDFVYEETKTHVEVAIDILM